MNHTPLHEEHLRLGARMVDFAGWDLPVMYTSILEEHAAARTAAALFDVSHMGEIILRGSGAERLLRRLVPTSMDRVGPGRGMYTCMCNEHGGVVDDIFIFMKSAGDYYLVVNAATTVKDLAWIRAHNDTGAAVEDASDATAKIDLQGPRAREIAVRVFGDGRIAGLERFHFVELPYGDGTVMISQSGYTGEHGYEFFPGAAQAVRLWSTLLEAGRDLGLRPAGLGARDTLRLEAAYSLYGHEINDEISPVEAGIGWFVNSADEYIGRDVLIGHKSGGAPREIICVELTGRGVPRNGCEVYAADGMLGIMTSGSYSPTLKKGIGLVLARRGVAAPGAELKVDIRGTRVDARAVKRPFYQYHD
jgi:aminomethyltransferase